MRKIIIMSEYGGFPLWESKKDGLTNFSAYNLPIPNDLAKKIEDWGDQFEATYVVNNPSSSGFQDDEDQNKFINEGQSLFYELKEVLGISFELEYRAINGNKFVS